MKALYKYWIIFFIQILFVISVKGQAIYMDPAVTAAITVGSSSLKSSQNQTQNLLGQIKTAQLAVTAQLEAANQLQRKIYKGLTDVSSALNDAYSVKNIYENTKRIINLSAEIVSFATENPQYSVFAIKETNEFKRRLLLMSTEVTTILTGGEFNMMNAGQRRQLIRTIDIEMKLLASQAWYILYTLKRAKSLGFWKSINPFQQWYNSDSRMAKDIIARSKYLKK